MLNQLKKKRNPRVRTPGSFRNKVYALLAASLILLSGATSVTLLAMPQNGNEVSLSSENQNNETSSAIPSDTTVTLDSSGSKITGEVPEIPMLNELQRLPEVLDSGSDVKETPSSTETPSATEGVPTSETQPSLKETQPGALSDKETMAGEEAIVDVERLGPQRIPGNPALSYDFSLRILLENPEAGGEDLPGKDINIVIEKFNDEGYAEEYFFANTDAEGVLRFPLESGVHYRFALTQYIPSYQWSSDSIYVRVTTDGVFQRSRDNYSWHSFDGVHTMRYLLDSPPELSVTKNVKVQVLVYDNGNWVTSPGIEWTLSGVDPKSYSSGEAPVELELSFSQLSPNYNIQINWGSIEDKYDYPQESFRLFLDPNGIVRYHDGIDPWEPFERMPELTDQTLTFHLYPITVKPLNIFTAIEQGFGNLITLGGAELRLMKLTEDGEELVRSWTSVLDQAESFLFTPGEYRLYEDLIPSGYTLLEENPLQIRLDESGRLQAKNFLRYENGQVIHDWTEIYSHTLVLRHEAASTNEQEVFVAIDKYIGSISEMPPRLPGCILRISELKDGQIRSEVDRWTTGANGGYGLFIKRDTEYVIEEVYAPPGFNYFEPIRFKILLVPFGEGAMDFIYYFDPISGEYVRALPIFYGIEIYNNSVQAGYLSITKYDESGSALAGAEIELVEIRVLLDGSSETYSIGQWTSLNQSTSWPMSAQRIYELRESKAPEGYKAVAPIRFRFAESAAGETIVQFYDVSTNSWNDAHPSVETSYTFEDDRYSLKLSNEKLPTPTPEPTTSSTQAPEPTSSTSSTPEATSSTGQASETTTKSTQLAESTSSTSPVLETTTSTRSAAEPTASTALSTSRTPLPKTGEHSNHAIPLLLFAIGLLLFFLKACYRQND